MSIDRSNSKTSVPIRDTFGWTPGVVFDGYLAAGCQFFGQRTEDMGAAGHCRHECNGLFWQLQGLGASNRKSALRVCSQW